MSRKSLTAALVVLSVCLLITLGVMYAQQGTQTATAPGGVSAGGESDQMHVPLIGEDAPAFKADSTQGPVNFPDDYKGKWVILFSHPGDFTPVCTTEFITFGAMQPQFEALNCQLIGLSVDSNPSHIAWLRTIGEKIKYRDMEHVNITFPLLADGKMEIARKYGMLHPKFSDTKTVRAVFLIDPKAKIRAVIYYPATNGRNFQEIERLLIALQTTDAHGVATPADWQPGDDVVMPAPGSCAAAAQRLAGSGKDYVAQDWFLSFKKLSKDQIKLPPEK